MKKVFQTRYGEMKANIMLCYRHLEDARMRLGKAIQAYDGGISVYPKQYNLNEIQEGRYDEKVNIDSYVFSCRVSTNDPRTTVPPATMDSEYAGVYTGNESAGATEDARSRATALPATNVEFASRH